MACRIPGISSKQHAKLKQTLSVSKVNGRPIFGPQFGPTDGIKFDHYKTDWDFD